MPHGQPTRKGNWGKSLTAVKELIKEHLEESLREKPTTDKIQIKKNGNRSHMTYKGH